MVELITGVPGSGKTSYAVTRLYKTFGKDLSVVKKIPSQFKIPDVDKAFTNINELKEEKFDNVHAVHFDDLVSKLTILEEHYRKDKWDDKQLNELATEYGISNSMYIIDECHNHFDVPNKVLVWWLSYHRHLHQHIILLTQNLALVNSKYKAFPEKFYKAVPNSLKILSFHNVYKVYTNSRMAKNSQAGTMKVRKIDEVFEAYVSGANHKSKSVILPFIFLSIAALVFVFLIFKFGFSNPVKEIDKTNTNTNTNTNNNQNVKQQKYGKQENSKINLEQKKMINVYCNDKECYYKDSFINAKFIDMIEDLDSQILFKSMTTKNTTKYTLLVSSSFYSLLGIEHKNKLVGLKNEDNTKNSDYYSITD